MFARPDTWYSIPVRLDRSSLTPRYTVWSFRSIDGNKKEISFGRRRISNARGVDSTMQREDALWFCNNFVTRRKHTYTRARDFDGLGSIRKAR